MVASYSIGHAALDDDHDRMIAAWRELEVSRTLDAAKLAAVRLMAEAGEHFTREETFMQQCGYPDLVRHKELHAQMASVLRKVILSPLMGDVKHEDFVASVRSLMEKWITVHILVEDARLAPYARAHAHAHASSSRRPAMAAARH